MNDAVLINSVESFDNRATEVRYAAPRPAAGPASRVAPGTYHVELIAQPGLIDPLDSDWNELARVAVEPNSFYEPWFVAAAAPWHIEASSWRLFRLWHKPDAPRAPSQLCGVFPLELMPRFGTWRLRHLRTWRHPYGFFGGPLVRAGHERAFWRELFTWADEQHGARFIDLSQQPGEGPLARALNEVLFEQGRYWSVMEQHTRALLERADTGDNYIDRALSKNNRTELRRRYRRLEESGQLAIRELESVSHLQDWIDEFLNLESSGWKGADRGAMRLDKSRGTFFTDLVTRGFCENRLELFGMFLDNRPVALKCNLLAGAGSFAFKIAYDEELARFSPGAQLELINIERFHRRAAADYSERPWMDSCATPDHPMINRLWGERRSIRRVAVSTHNRLGDLALGLLAFRKSAASAVRGRTASSPASICKEY